MILDFESMFAACSNIHLPHLTLHPAPPPPPNHTLWHWWRLLMKINSSKVVISLIVTVEPIDNSIPSDLPISLPANKIPEQREKLTVLVSTGKLKEALGSQLINRRNPFQMRLWRNVINCTRLTTWRKTYKTLIIIELFDAQ